MIVHGGAWYATGRELTIANRRFARRFTAAGFATFNVDYRPGGDSLVDVTHFYDRLRRRVGRRKPICIWGGSAGGHLALMVATRRPRVACVIAEAAPTMLAKLPGDVGDMGRRAFGGLPGGLAAYSPALLAAKVKSPTLLAYATNDRLVPHDQGTAYARRARTARLVKLKPGTRPFIHSRVDGRQLRRLVAAERRLVSRAALPPLRR
jgi:acetyl esterase/lipase